MKLEEETFVVRMTRGNANQRMRSKPKIVTEDARFARDAREAAERHNAGWRADWVIGTLDEEAARKALEEYRENGSGRTGPAEGNRRLNPVAVRAIRWLSEHTDKSYPDLASAYGVRRSSVGKIVRRESYPDVD